MFQQFSQSVEERLLRYVKIDTQSDESTGTVPTTAKQYNILRPPGGQVDRPRRRRHHPDYATVLATLPATVPNADAIPTIAFLAHVDTAPAFSGTGVKPRMHRNYDGSPITYPGTRLVLSSAGSPYLAEKVGEDIMTNPSGPPCWVRTTSPAWR